MRLVLLVLTGGVGYTRSRIQVYHTHTNTCTNRLPSGDDELDLLSFEVGDGKAAMGRR